MIQRVRDRAGLRRSLVRVGVLLLAVCFLCVASCRARGIHGRPAAPSGYVEMTVDAVYNAGEGGKAVTLVDLERRTLLPIFIGGTEALSIQLRHEHQKYQRPLTHDLLDSVVRELKGEIVKVHVNELKDNVYLGAVFVRDGSRVAEIDARPSDAIALALGSEVPIFVAQKVLTAAGMPKAEFDRMRGGGSPRERAPEGTDPMSL